MYSQNDLDEAVAAGALSAEAAAALRNFVDSQRASPAVDEENFRLITGFNDIFVVDRQPRSCCSPWAGSASAIGQRTGLVVDHRRALAAGAAGGRRDQLGAWRCSSPPSAAWRCRRSCCCWRSSAAVFATAGFDLGRGHRTGRRSRIIPQLGGSLGAVSAAIAAAAAWLHWRRFRVPITVAAGAAAVAGIAVACSSRRSATGRRHAQNLILGFVLLLGIGVFLFAMWWDGSDRARVTRRSDVAFWLHLLAAPMIVHPVFTLLGLNDGTATIGEGLVVILLYVVLGITALAIDRRALLVSALAYVLYALTELFKQFGAVELNVALTALVIGSALLMLSAFWHQARAAVVVRHCPAALREQAAARRPAGGYSRNQPHEPALDRGQDAVKLVAPLEHRAMLRDQRKRPLLQAKLGAFFDPDFGPLGCRGGRPRKPPPRGRTTAHSRASARPRPSARKGRGCAAARHGRMQRSDAGPADAETA